MTKKNNESLFSTHPWQITIDKHNPEQQLLVESLFALANGYIGTRGTYEEPAPEGASSCEGVYLNGVYQQEPIEYGESAYGFATHNHKMIQVPNGKRIELILDGHCLSFTDSDPHRRFDLSTGILHRTQDWTMASGKRIKIHSQRFVSLANQQLMCIRYDVTAENFSGSIELMSYLDASYEFQVNKDDPRVGRLSIADSLTCISQEQSNQANEFLHAVEGSNFKIASYSIDEFTRPVQCLNNIIESGLLGHHYRFELKEGETITLYKWVGYQHANDLKENAILQTLIGKIKQASKQGFEHQLARHKEQLEAFWRDADVMIDGDDKLQQGLRFNMFHLFQSTGRNGQSNIGAKGLTGHGYDGHYFWDTEIYVIPFLCYTKPELARKLIEFRINKLPKARERARIMSHDKGALYPWRTIGGEECSAYFPAGTAQYHINADIAYALKCYIQATNDTELLWQGGAEMLFETARLWMELGHFNPARGDHFCIDGVTGPDEYTAIVNNNFYTNSMAKLHLQFAADVAQKLEKLDSAAFNHLKQTINFTLEELNSWMKAAKNMYLPYDETRKIHKQDDTFLAKAVWDFKNTPSDKYPLLLHYHPLVIYRHQVLKQADVVLAMYLLDEQFDVEQKKRNLAYYEPLTTHDSSLSSCIHALEFAETGDINRAYEFFTDTALMDLENHHGNSPFGVHIACMAGSWAAIVHGFAGMRARSGGLYFKPQLPKHWKGFNFKVSYQGCKLQVTIAPDFTRYQLLDGSQLQITEDRTTISLTKEQPNSIIHAQSREPVL